MTLQSNVGKITAIGHPHAEGAAGRAWVMCAGLPLNMGLKGFAEDRLVRLPHGTDLRGGGFEESENELPGEEVAQHRAEVLAARLDGHDLPDRNTAEDAFQQVLLRVEKGHQCCRRGPGRRRHPLSSQLPSATVSMHTLKRFRKTSLYFPKTI